MADRLIQLLCLRKISVLRIKSKRIKSNIKPHLGALALLFLMAPAPAPAQAADSQPRDVYRQLDLFGQILETVRKEHVAPKNDEELIRAAINGMLSSLDPHSSWLDPETYKNMQISTRGEFGGLGIEVTMENGLIKVVTPIDGTPADRAGVLASDLITHLDGAPVLGMTLSEAVSIMRGKPRTKIKITIRRGNRKEPLNIVIIRDIIEIKAVSSRSEGQIGYLRLTTFNERATENLSKAIRKLQRETRNGPQGYILDLRNNPGGLLDQAVSVADLFLRRGEIVSIRGRADKGGQSGDRYNARGGDITDDKPIIVLINGGSASASEIVAGALQDQRRAITLGTLSFGKGSVQTVRPLGQGNGALRLTTARYYTPSGRSIQAHGVVPDIVIRQKLDKKDKDRLGITGETDLRGHLDSSDKDKRSGSASFIPKEKGKDTQLNYALDLMRAVVVNNSLAAK